MKNTRCTHNTCASRPAKPRTTQRIVTWPHHSQCAMKSVHALPAAFSFVWEETPIAHAPRLTPQCFARRASQRATNLLGFKAAGATRDAPKVILKGVLTQIDSLADTIPPKTSVCCPGDNSWQAMWVRGPPLYRAVRARKVPCELWHVPAPTTWCTSFAPYAK